MEDDEWLEFKSEIDSLFFFEQENENKAARVETILKVWSVVRSGIFCLV
jgi:hypothetical protein